MKYAVKDGVPVDRKLYIDEVVVGITDSRSLVVVGPHGIIEYQPGTELAECEVPPWEQDQSAARIEWMSQLENFYSGAVLIEDDMSVKQWRARRKLLSLRMKFDAANAEDNEPDGADMKDIKAEMKEQIRAARKKAKG